MSYKPCFFKEPHTLSGHDKKAPVLIGLSGGADSSALLHLLCAYREEAGCEIFAAHLNHGIRTDKYENEADRDEEFCQELCKSLNVKLFSKKLDIPSLSSSSGKSLETEARDARYAFFADVMRKNDIKILATAHNADDNLETQLSNLARGCGIDGMIGIPEIRAFDSVDGGIVIRPILRAEKSEIIGYCNENNVPYVTDSTNFENDCTRNIIRHNIIPRLEELFPKAKKAATRLSSAAAEDSDFIMGEAQIFISKFGNNIPVSELKALHPALKKRVIMLSFERFSGARLENIHISDIISLLDSKKNGTSLSLPQKASAIIADGYLTFKSNTAAEPKNVNYCHKLNFGLNFIENTPFAVYVGKKNTASCPDGHLFYASAEIKTNNTEALYVKNRCEGASILDGGVNKKIKKLMTDKKVPLFDRSILPIIYSEDEALYIPLCAVCDRAKKKAGDEAVCIEIFKAIGGTHE